MEEKTTDMMTATAESAAQTEDRRDAALRELTARIDVTDPRLQHRYGETVLGALAEAIETAENEKLLQESRITGEFSLPSDSLVVLTGLKLLFTKVFCSTAVKEESLQKQYAESEKNVDSVTEALEAQQLILTKEIEKLDNLLAHCGELQQLLSVYCQAGRQRLRREKETTLSSKKEIASRTGLSRDAQNVREFEEQCRLFEARLHTLEEKTAISEQVLPQLNLLKAAKADLARQLHEFLVGDMPMWKETARVQGDFRDREEGLRAADRAFSAALEKLNSAAEESAQTVSAAGKSLTDLAQRLRGETVTE